MSAIQASSAGVKDMADGSLRITFEFDPRYAKEAYTLFGARGTSCAIAALTQESTIKAAQVEAQEPKTKAGQLCIIACNYCEHEDFQEYVAKLLKLPTFHASPAKAREYICNTCGVTTRKELDAPPFDQNFLRLIRAPFLEWMED